MPPANKVSLAEGLLAKQGHDKSHATLIAIELDDAQLLSLETLPLRDLIIEVDALLGESIAQGKEFEAALKEAIDKLTLKYAKKGKPTMPTSGNDQAHVTTFGDMRAIIYEGETPVNVVFGLIIRDKDVREEDIVQQATTLRNAMQALADTGDFRPHDYRAIEAVRSDLRMKENAARDENKNAGSRPNRGAADQNARRGNDRGQGSNNRGRGGNDRGRGGNDRPPLPAFEGKETPKPRQSGVVEVRYIAWKKGGRGGAAYSFYDGSGKYVCSTFDPKLFDLAAEYDGFVEDVQSAPEKQLVSLPASWWVLTVKNGDYTNLDKVVEPWYGEYGED